MKKQKSGSKTDNKKVKKETKPKVKKEVKPKKETKPKLKKIYLNDIIDVEKYAKKGYIPYERSKTKLTKINKKPELKEKHINKLKRSGRVEISTKKELENFPLGSYVSYVTKEGKYRSGGFLKVIKDEYFVLQGGSKQHPISFCVQFKNIDVIYVKNAEVYEK